MVRKSFSTGLVAFAVSGVVVAACATDNTPDPVQKPSTAGGQTAATSSGNGVTTSASNNNGSTTSASNNNGSTTSGPSVNSSGPTTGNATTGGRTTGSTPTTGGQATTGNNGNNTVSTTSANTTGTNGFTSTTGSNTVSTTSANTTGASATSATTGASATGPVVLTVNTTGYVDPADPVNMSVGVGGSWYTYVDTAGGSTVMPDTSTTPLAVTGGKICFSGNVAAKKADSNYGIGLGLDFNMKLPWNASGKGITGFSFTASGVPAGAVIEVPDPTTSPAGGDTGAEMAAPITSGANPVSFSALKQPNWVMPATAGHEAALDTTSILSVKIHVPPSTAAIIVSNFCISAFTLLRP